MKQYLKTYENVFSTDRPKSGSLKLNLEKVKVGEMELDEYVDLFRTFLTGSYIRIFDDAVRLSWLRRKFSYYNHPTVLPMHKNFPILNSAFVKLLRRNVGKDIQIVTRSKSFAKLETYFNDLFPGFDEGNPFENPDYYKFPFRNISVDFLLVVHQLDDRMALLKIADDRKMSYAVFMDYVINHVYSANEELGRQRYEIVHNDRHFPFTIKDTDKKLKGKSKRK